jgi:hypothetical protein
MRTARERATLIARMASGNAALVHVSFPLGGLGGPAPKQLLVGPLDAHSPALPAQPVWDAPADPAFPGRSFFVLAPGREMAAGERVLVYAPAGAPAEGALVSAGAMVIAEGRAWCYVEEQPGRFVRRALDTTQPTDDGYFVRDGVKSGEQVVTAGAGLLLARETAPAGGEAE